MDRVRRQFQLILAILLLSGLMSGSPQVHAYSACGQDWPEQPYLPRGDCVDVARLEMTWGGRSSRVFLKQETAAVGVIDSSTVSGLQQGLQRRILPAVGSALERIPGASIQPEIHIYLVDDRPEETIARTVSGSTLFCTDQCHVVLYHHPERSADSMARTLAHELFHCVQQQLWRPKIGDEGSRWWSEGSAAWFEDFALPDLHASSNLDTQLQLFRERSATYPLTESTYSSVVFFSWLGPERMTAYLSLMADPGMSQNEGARRAMTAEGYLDFARAYVDENIVTPSGIRLADSYGPDTARVHETTGTPGADPDYDSGPVRAFVLARGEILFRSADYEPVGSFGEWREVFSVERGSWAGLPAAFELRCDARRHVRFAVMAVRDGRLRLTPGTTGAATDGADCTCPLGSWTIAPEDLQAWLGTPERDIPARTIQAGSRTLSFPAVTTRRPGEAGYLGVSGGDVSMTFSADGTASFVGNNIVITHEVRGSGVLASTTFDRSYQGRWNWTVDRYGLINMDPVMPLRLVEITTRRGPGGMSRTERSSESETDEPSRHPFECRDGQLLIGRPVLVADFLPEAFPRLASEDPARQALIDRAVQQAVRGQRGGRSDAPLRPSRRHYPKEGRYTRLR